MMITKFRMENSLYIFKSFEAYKNVVFLFILGKLSVCCTLSV